MQYKNTLLICTNNLVPRRLFNKVLTNAFIQAESNKSTSVVVVSHYPVFEQYDDDFKDVSKIVEHKNFKNIIIKEPFFNTKDFSCDSFNVVVGEREYNKETIFYQMLLGCDVVDSENIIIMEHDVLYPHNYLSTTSGVFCSGIDACYWSNGMFFSKEGFFEVSNVMTLSRFSLKTDVFREVFKNKFEKGLKFVEPVLKGIPVCDDIDNEVVIKKYAMLYGNDTLDIRHGLNVSGNFIVQHYATEHEYWGHYDEIYPLICGEQRTFVEEHPCYNYGIWT